MFIQKLALKNYRNYRELTLNFENNIHIFIGDNAQGKTNIVEAIYYASFLKSHRFSKDLDLILFGHDFASVEFKLSTTYKPYQVKLIISEKGKKVLVNQVDQKRLSDYIGLVHTVMFSPEDIDLIKGTPNVRRRFLDMEITQVNHQYLEHLNRYNKILKQRNEYLKSLMLKENHDLTFLEVLTTQLIRSASFIYEQRFLYVKRLLEITKGIHKTISNHQDELFIKYQSGVNLEYTDYNNVFQFLEKKFKEIQNREIRQGQTLFGPHKDDLEFFINDKSVRIYGSQGQQRSVVLSLKLAEIDLIKEKTGEYPILILDDVLSELDDFRKNHLIHFITDRIQTFVTTTSLDGVSQELLHKADKFYVEEAFVQRI